MRSILARCKSLLARFVAVVEFCHDCGREQPLIWHADDALWKAVHGDGGGIYCPECFTKRAEAKGFPIVYWTAATEFRNQAA